MYLMIIIHVIVKRGELIWEWA